MANVNRLPNDPSRPFHDRQDIVVDPQANMNDLVADKNVANVEYPRLSAEGWLSSGAISPELVPGAGLCRGRGEGILARYRPERPSTRLFNVV